MKRPNNPAMKEPSSGSKTMAEYNSALQQIDVFDRDGAAIAEIDDQDGEPDGGLGGGHRQHEEGEDLADQVTQKGGERHEVDVDREQNQLDRHQDDDDVLAVEEDAEHADGEEQRSEEEIVPETDGHVRPPAPASRPPASSPRPARARFARGWIGGARRAAAAASARWRRSSPPAARGLPAENNRQSRCRGCGPALR